MSLWPSVLFSLVRAALVVGLALPAAAPIARRLREDRAGLWWAATLAPLLVPELLTGYGWSNFSLSLAADPGANEALTAALIWGRCVCAAAALLAVAPAPARTASAVFLRKLMWSLTPRPRGASALGAWLKEGALRTLARFGPAAGVAGLYAFGQFETPSLAGTTAWTVTLFDAHARMIDLWDSLRLAWPAAAVQLVGLVPLLIWLRGVTGPGRRDERRAPASRRSNFVAGLTLAAAGGLTVVVPAAVVAGETGAEGFRTLAESGWRAQQFAAECGRSLAIGTVAAAVATGLLWAVGRVRGPAGTVLLAGLIAPGLCGSLIVGLVVQAGLTAAAAHGWPGARAVRDSAVPLILALAVVLLPRAALLRAFAEGRTAGRFLTRLLRTGTLSQRRAGGRLWWGLTGRAAWVRGGLLTLWAAADVAAAAVLLPPGLETAPPGLYNLMHYGHNAVLGALCLLNTVLPAVLLALGAWAAPRLAGAPVGMVQR
ncbi:hypothetical protein [Alienimonas californiensis]|uniref:ABC transmembrane type-1 domain-containing protein n=1 Tax=Alienimonas californiensis TaxID=2527989 RepID=A0A517PC33_9PLAN|nr:hypothetical protein [Alienimonas californiensis]QDT16919.1 hypothetical protein CA12_30280 [Alienimonas californiensis]